MYPMKINATTSQMYERRPTGVQLKTQSDRYQLDSKFVTEPRSFAEPGKGSEAMQWRAAMYEEIR